ncbi:MAG: class I SAM-dependent methyltransferase [Candidatus Thermoplasmatota archaeon]|nr:class I SAM-dependent methyltransferase [Candidatus Thermoplasmatota archaeon]
MARDASPRPFSSLWEVDSSATKSIFVRENLMLTYGNIATHFDATRRRPWPATVDFIKVFSKGDHIIDIGCGNGRNAVYMAGRGFRVTGLDMSPELLELATENAREKEVGHLCDFIHGDMTELPFNDDEFDGGLYIASLHHLGTNDERLASLNELSRVLRPGAWALLTVWDRDLEKFRELLDIWEKHLLFERGDVFIPWKSGVNEWPRYYHLFTDDEFRTLLEMSDLVVDGTFRSGENHYGKVQKR